jgi:hypothetical protein
MLSAYSKSLALRFLLQADDTGRPSAWGIGLTTTPPTDTSFTEPTDPGYTRQPATFSSPITADNAVPDNATATFGPFASTNTVYGYALMDGAGNVLFFDSFAAPITVRPEPDLVLLAPVRTINIGAAAGRNNVSLYGCNLILNYACRGVGTPPPVCAVGLATAAPIPSANDGQELIDGGYTRQVVALTPGLSGVPPDAWSNPNPFSFGPFSNDVTIAGADIYDATSGGNLLFGGQMGEPMSFAAGQAFTWAAQHLWARLV